MPSIRPRARGTPPRPWLDVPVRALQHPWAPAVLAALAFGISLWIQRTVYPGLSWNRDEPVYLWQVDVLRHGQLAAPDGGRPTVFLPWLSAAREGEIFSQYTLGWPLVLAAAALLGSPDLGIAAGAALAVFGSWALAHELLHDRLVAGVTALLMLCSPLLLVQSGTHLNYLFTLGLGLLFSTALIAGVRLASRWRLVTAGALLGWVALTRPFDAVVWGGLTVAYLAVVHRGRWAEHLRRAHWLLLGLAPLLGVVLYLNLRLTGRITEFPITVADPLDRFGFGDRRLMPRFSKVAYGKRMALTSLARNSWWLPFFLVGAHVGAILAAAGAWLGRRRWPTVFLLGLGVAFPISYFPFFGTHISSLTARLSGPIYFIPAYFSLSALMAVALVHLCRTSPRWALGAVAALVVITTPIAVDRLRTNLDLSRANLPWRDSVAHLAEPSLVVVSPSPYLLFLNPFAVNGHDLQDDVLYAADAGPEVLDLVADHPDRRPYLQRSSLETRLLAPTEDARTPEVTLTPLEIVEGPGIRLSTSVAPPAGHRVAATWIEVDGGTASQVRRSTASAFDVAWTLVPAAADGAITDFAVPPGLRTVHVVTGWGDTVREARRSPAVRRTFYVRSSPQLVELLGPGTVAQFELPEHGVIDERAWIELLDTQHLQVEVASTGPPSS